MQGYLAREGLSWVSNTGLLTLLLPQTPLAALESICSGVALCCPCTDPWKCLAGPQELGKVAAVSLLHLTRLALL